MTQQNRSAKIEVYARTWEKKYREVVETLPPTKLDALLIAAIVMDIFIKSASVLRNYPIEGAEFIEDGIELAKYAGIYDYENKKVFDRIDCGGFDSAIADSLLMGAPEHPTSIYFKDVFSRIYFGPGLPDNMAVAKLITKIYYCRVSAFPALLTADAFTQRIDWRSREKLRMIQTTYKPVPWFEDKRLLPIKDHFVHQSTENPEMVAFTQDSSKGERDIQTSMRPGRYLTRYYSDVLTEDEIRGYVARYSSWTELKIAYSTDEIYDVYRKCTTGSCMSHDTDSYDTRGTHPTAVYGYDSENPAIKPDTACAYILNPCREISARCLVWPAEKRYGRIYGDTDRMMVALENAGYNLNNTGLEGAKIRKIALTKKTFVMPYIDGCQSFGEYDENFFVIDGEYAAENTDGTASIVPARKCDCCGETYCEDDGYAEVEGETYCRNCVDDHAIMDHYSSEYILETNSVRVAISLHNNRPIYCDTHCDIVNDHAFLCGYYNEYFDVNRFSPIEMENGETWSCYAFAEHGIEVNGKNYAQGEEPAEEEQDLFATKEDAA